MIMKSMSLIARRELQAIARQKYRDASWTDKRKILDGFVVATGYERKYAFQLLNSDEIPLLPKNRPASQRYDGQVWQALISVWSAANQTDGMKNQKFIIDIDENNSKVTSNDMSCTQTGKNVVVCGGTALETSTIEIWSVISTKKLQYSRKQ